MSIQNVVDAAQAVGKTEGPEQRAAIGALLDAIDGYKAGVSDEIVDDLVLLAQNLRQHVGKQFEVMVARFQSAATTRLA